MTKCILFHDKQLPIIKEIGDMKEFIDNTVGVPLALVKLPNNLMIARNVAPDCGPYRYKTTLKGEVIYGDFIVFRYVTTSGENGGLLLNYQEVTSTDLEDVKRYFMERRITNDFLGTVRELKEHKDISCALCGATDLTFKDAVSEKEFNITHTCQKCQDELFKEPEDEDEDEVTEEDDIPWYI
jgi:hypothetical protein